MKIDIGRKPMDMAQLAALCGGRLIGSGIVSRLCTDSREANDAETLFEVIVGEKVDAHDYMKKAYDGGCRNFLCQRIPEEMAGLDDFCAVVTEDTVEAMGAIAAAYTEARQGRAIAITGSVGKTTTKEFIAAVMAEGFCVHKTKSNHNSTIGLPISMLEATEEQNISVVEMGMSGLGEIGFMSRVAKPCVACITNIGHSHLEILGTRENICRAKLEILWGMPPDGVVFLNRDEPLLRRMCPPTVDARFVSLRGEGDVAVTNIRYGAEGSMFDVTVEGVSYRDVTLSVIGEPFVWAAAFAIGVGLYMGLDMDAVRRGLAAFRNADMRQNITHVGGVTLIEDCYNAGPESVMAAIDIMKTLSDASGGRMMALLGDMRELGDNSAALHRRVGEYYAEQGGRWLFGFGPLTSEIVKGAEGCAGLLREAYATDEDAAAMGEAILKELREGDILLVKASRAIGAERVSAYIKDRLCERA